MTIKLFWMTLFCGIFILMLAAMPVQEFEALHQDSWC
jgi:hypothetical protein